MLAFEGFGVSLITPFDEKNRIDYLKLENLIEFQIRNQGKAIIVGGVTGEVDSLTMEEHIELVKRTVDFVNGRVPIIAGAGTNNTEYSIRIAKELNKYKIDGLLVPTPYYNRSNFSGYVKHFEVIAKSSNVPIILHNSPDATGVSLSLDLIVSLSKNANIIGIKEDSGDITFASEISRLCGEQFNLYSGRDDIVLPILSIGGKGIISEVGNIIPNEMNNICELYKKGLEKEARTLHFKYYDFIRDSYLESPTIFVKKSLKLIGLCEECLRAPLDKLSTELTNKLLVELKNLDIKID